MDNLFLVFKIRRGCLTGRVIELTKMWLPRKFQVDTAAGSLGCMQAIGGSKGSGCDFTEKSSVDQKELSSPELGLSTCFSLTQTMHNSYFQLL
jgi:hypothetical protein